MLHFRDGKFFWNFDFGDVIYYPCVRIEIAHIEGQIRNSEKILDFLDSTPLRGLSGVLVSPGPGANGNVKDSEGVVLKESLLI